MQLWVARMTFITTTRVSVCLLVQSKGTLGHYTVSSLGWFKNKSVQSGGNMSKQLVYIHTKSPAVRKEDEKTHTTGFKDGDQRVGSSEHVCETEMV